MYRFNSTQETEIMAKVLEVAAAAAGNEHNTPSVEKIDDIVRTVFTTVCELLGEDVPGSASDSEEN